MSTTLPAFLDELVAALQVRAGLSGVNIYGCPVTPEDLGEEGIELAEEVGVDTEREDMSGQVESYTITGSILVLRPLAKGVSTVSTINAAAKAARDRCAAILAEVLSELTDDDTAGGTVRDVQIQNQTWRQGFAPEAQMGRVCSVEFGMLVKSPV